MSVRNLTGFPTPRDRDLIWSTGRETVGKGKSCRRQSPQEDLERKTVNPETRPFC